HTGRGFPAAGAAGPPPPLEEVVSVFLCPPNPFLSSHHKKAISQVTDTCSQPPVLGELPASIRQTKVALLCGGRKLRLTARRHRISDNSRPQPRLRAGETDNFLVFYEALVLWGYTATAATQDQTEGKIIFIKFVDPHPLHSVLSLRHHCHCLAQPGRHTARPMLVLLPSKPHTVWYQHWLIPETMAGAKHWYP
ncbi:hypothetical protein Pmani_035100, partial [Petrolisthes manimaculis]